MFVYILMQKVARPVGNTPVTCWSVGAKAVMRSETTMVTRSSRTISLCSLTWLVFEGLFAFCKWAYYLKRKKQLNNYFIVPPVPVSNPSQHQLQAGPLPFHAACSCLCALCHLWPSPGHFHSHKAFIVFMNPVSIWLSMVPTDLPFPFLNAVYCVANLGFCIRIQV